MSRRLIVVGAGRVGLSLATDLAGWPALERLTVVGRRSGRPPPLAALPGVEYRVGPPRGGRETARDAASDLVFCVRDDDLGAAVEEWAAALAGAEGATGMPGSRPAALHTSGARPSADLARLAAGGRRSLGSWHPLAAVAEPAAGAFRGVTVGVEGEAEAVELGRALAARVGARAVLLPAGGKVRYHAAAVFASNYLLACLGAALAELRGAGGDTVPEDALLPLARSALANYARLGLTGGATGPLSRGDVETVAAHLAALDPSRRALYRALGRELLVALRPALAPGVAERLDELLGAP